MEDSLVLPQGNLPAAKFELQGISDRVIKAIRALDFYKIQNSDYTVVQSTRVFPAAIVRACEGFKLGASPKFVTKLETVIGQITECPFDGQCRVVGEVEATNNERGAMEYVAICYRKYEYRGAFVCDFFLMQQSIIRERNWENIGTGLIKVMGGPAIYAALMKVPMFEMFGTINLVALAGGLIVKGAERVLRGMDVSLDSVKEMVEASCV